MSSSDPRSLTDLALPNSTTQKSLNLSDPWILNSTYNIQATPDITVRRVTAFDFIREGFVKVNSEIPVLFILQLAKYIEVPTIRSLS
jgi:hypothetical protein